MKDIFIREAIKKEEVFKNLPKLLKEIKKILNKMDKESKIFIFGSVAKNEHVLISDIDVLILTKLKPNEVIAKLRKEGFDEPFEFHVMDEERFRFYKQFIKELKEIK